METRATLSAGVPAPAPARVETAPVRAAVRTELDPPKAVAAQAGSEQTRFDRDKKQAQSGNGSKQTASTFDIDRETGELVYKVIDQETENVLAQYPYDSLLRLRAYIRSQDENSGN